MSPSKEEPSLSITSSHPTLPPPWWRNCRLPLPPHSDVTEANDTISEHHIIIRNILLEERHDPMDNHHPIPSNRITRMAPLLNTLDEALIICAEVVEWSLILPPPSSSEPEPEPEPEDSRPDDNEEDETATTLH